MVVTAVVAAAAVVLIVVGIGWDYHNSSVSMNYADQGIEKAVSDLDGERFRVVDGLQGFTIIVDADSGKECRVSLHSCFYCAA